MKQRFFEIAKAMSRRSEHAVHKIGGVVIKKGRIISVGWNKSRTHPKSNHPFKNTHCELDCILGVDPELLRGATLYLYRENKAKVPVISKPCQWCHRLLMDCGISKVVYSYEGSYKEEKIK